MSANHKIVGLAPWMLRSGFQTVRGNPRPTRFAPSVALLLSERHLTTDTNTSSGGRADFPPPGFNANEAKKPTPKEEQSPASTRTEQKPANKSTEAETFKNVKFPKDGSTAHAKIKAEERMSISELAGSKVVAEKHEGKDLTDQRKEKKKLTLSEKIKKEIAHYWDGTKLLAAEVKISTKLALKMAAGYELTRRENRQLQRTVQDLGRLVPFSVFVIVPFAELLLPVALKLFPNLLPSTYEGQKTKESKANTLRATRKDVSNFLQQTLKESGLPVKPSNAQKEEFLDFFKKLRNTGESPTPDDVIKVCKAFKDDLTLDNLSRPQLVAICRYMNLGTFGTDTLLRYNIRHRMRQIKRDDKAISYEGVESLSVPELQNAAASRGLRTHGVSPARLREDLQMWLDLRLKYGVPSTLLVLSNAFMYAQGKEKELDSQIDALQAVLSSIPEELFHEIELEIHNAEGAATNRQRLEVLREQQELIDEENEQSESQTGKRSAKSSTPKDDQDIDEKEEREESAEVQSRNRDEKEDEGANQK